MTDHHSIIDRLGDTSKNDEVKTLRLANPDTKETLLLDGKPIEVDYVGSESREFLEANHLNRRLNRERDFRGEEFDPEVEDTNVLRGLAMCTKGWRNVPAHFVNGDHDMSPVEFSIEAAQKLYRRLSWARTQISLAIWKRDVFGKTS